ncbi:MAG: nuclear transport factor 2 family protein [Thiobacillus sp.]
MTMAGKVQPCFRVFERKDRAAWVTLCAYDAVLGIPAHEPPLAGQSALSELFDRIAALFATMRSEVMTMPVAGLHADTVFRLNAVSAGGKAAHAEGGIEFAADCDGGFTRIAWVWNPAPVLR